VIITIYKEPEGYYRVIIEYEESNLYCVLTAKRVWIDKIKFEGTVKEIKADAGNVREDEIFIWTKITENV